MNIQKILEKSISIIDEYYKNNISYFLDCMHDDVLWLGPSDVQRIKTKKLLIDTFSKEKHNLTFSAIDIKADCIFQTKSHCEVLLTFIVDTFYPDDTIVRCNQRIHFSWKQTEITDENGNSSYEPQIIVCNISNSIPYDNRDTIYPVHFTSLPMAKGFILNHSDEKKIKVQGKGNSIFYVAESQIVYISNSDHYATIHTINNDFECAVSLSELEKELPDSFVRCHISYMINTQFVKSIKRFQVLLETGVQIRIPEKKYTKVRDMINSKLDKINH